jgi:hypothetical protein
MQNAEPATSHGAAGQDRSQTRTGPRAGDSRTGASASGLLPGGGPGAGQAARCLIVLVMVGVSALPARSP